jgi:hypothetical protein
MIKTKTVLRDSGSGRFIKEWLDGSSEGAARE